MDRIDCCRRWIRWAAIVTIAVAPLHTLAASLVPLGDLPGASFESKALGISADGGTVVGYGRTVSGSTSGVPEAFRWTINDGMVGLGDLAGGIIFSMARNVSADGNTVVGFSSSTASAYDAFRWTSSGGLVSIGDLAGGIYQSQAYASSADGAVVVGHGRSESGPEAFRWTAADGIVGLGDLAGGGFGSVALDVSSDGSVVVGYSQSGVAYNDAYRWTSETGMTSLGSLPGPCPGGSAHAVSADGAVIVGEAGCGLEVFRWTSESGMVGLGDVPGKYSYAYDVSADGDVIVGQHVDSTTDAEEAFVWTQASGMQPLMDVLAAGGATGLTGWTFQSAQAVSANGHWVAGYGINPAGQTEAFLANIERNSPPTPFFKGVAGREMIEALWLGSTSENDVDRLVGGLGVLKVARRNARGEVPASGPNILEVGAYAGGDPSTHDAGRGVAFRTFHNSSTEEVRFRVNAVLDGRFDESPFGLPTGKLVATAAIYVVDTLGLARKLQASGKSIQEFLLDGNALEFSEDYEFSLSPRFGSSLKGADTVYMHSRDNQHSDPFVINEPMLVELATGFITVAPGANITVIFDVSAQSTAASFAGTQGKGSASFYNSLVPAVDMFTDVEGNPVTSLQEDESQSGGDVDADDVVDSFDNCPATANSDQANSDMDAIGDACDNCTLVTNADQLDTDNDGYGNRCDADLNNSGGIVNYVDLALFRSAFGTEYPNADLDGSGGIVNFTDLALFRALFGKPPGPSGTRSD